MSAADARVSSTVGDKYRITRFIAEGGMGAVYEAQHLFVRRRFAIKFLRRELAQRRDVIARFKDEAQAAGALEHENIAAVVDFGVAGDGTPYLVMEYLDGSDLGALLAATGPLPAERAADLVLQAALGAHAAHAAGVVHRDLKPQNLFVCRRNDGTDLLKLLDFGIAKLQASDAREAVTRTGTVLGTPAYMSPEQARGETGLDARTDVYSLGVILYELLSGELPHPGDSHNAVIHHIATESALPLACKSGAVPDDLAELVVATLSREASARPASAEELSERLRPFAQRKAWAPSERPPSPEVAPGHESTLPAPVAFSGAAAREDGPARPDRATKTTRRWVPMLGLLVLAGAVALANALLREPAAPSVPAKMTKPGPEPAPSAASLPSALPATTVQPEQIPPATSPAASTHPSEQESAILRPVRPSQRPDGQPSATQLRAKPPPAASADETGARFDDHNPYR